MINLRTQHNEEPYINVAAAILEQAVIDYQHYNWVFICDACETRRTQKERGESCPKCRSSDVTWRKNYPERKGAARFFQTNWFFELCRHLGLEPETFKRKAGVE